MNNAEKLALAQRIAKHKAPPIHLTTDQLGEAMIRTVKQMNPVEKMQLRRQLNRALLTKTARRLQRCEDVLIGMKCDPRPQ
ncbi:MAG: hypothetical protein WCC97_11915 [Candidatus Acidiferrales bacterium]